MATYETFKRENKFHIKRKRHLEPVKSVKEWAAEFGVTWQFLVVTMRNDKTSPKAVLSIQSTNRKSQTFYTVREMRQWWKKQII